MKAFKEIVKMIGNHTAYESVGKSVPITLYEPKVPDALKEKSLQMKKQYKIN